MCLVVIVCRQSVGHRRHSVSQADAKRSQLLPRKPGRRRSVRRRLLRPPCALQVPLAVLVARTGECVCADDRVINQRNGLDMGRGVFIGLIE